MITAETDNNSYLIDDLTEEEKISLLSAGDSYCLSGIARLGIPSVKITTETKGCIKSGRAGSADFTKFNFTCFPSLLLASCGFDRELLKEMGETIAKECLANEISAYMISCAVLDSPYYGRCYELSGEDPYLTGELIAAFVVGLQTYGISAVLTDFAVYTGEHDRMRHNICVEETYLRERYLKPFEKAIQKASPGAVMVSENKLNGTYVAESHLINLLKEEYGFNGIVLSGWGGVNDRAESLKAGVHVELNASECALDDKDLVHESVKAILSFIEGSRKSKITGYQYDRTYHHKAAEKIAEESICLLKNEDNILPLSPKDTIAVIGRAVDPVVQGYGSSHMQVSMLDDPLYSMREITPSLTGSNIIYSEGYDNDTQDIRRELVYETCRTVMNAKTVVMFLGLDKENVTEGRDLMSLDLPANQIDLIDSVYQYNKNIVVIINSPSCINMPWIDKVKAVIDIKIPGEAAGPAIANILYGIVNPSGKLSLAYPGLFPFGFGLSYTDFKYDDIYVMYDSKNDTYDISFILENIGKVSGREVVLLYAGMSDMGIKHKRLTGFCKPELKPGEKKRVTFKVPKNDLAVHDTEEKRKIVLTGAYTFMICASEKDIRLSITTYIEGDNPIERSFVSPDRSTSFSIEQYKKGELFTLDSTVKELRESRAGARLYPMVFKWAAETMGLNKAHPTYHMNMALFLNTPVKKLSRMSGGKLTAQRLQGLVDMCNGKTIKGISKLLF